MSCQPLNSKCDDDELVDSMTKFIEAFEKDPASSIVAISKKDFQLTKRSLNKYKKDCGICMRKGGGDYKCMHEAKQNLLRGIPMLGNAIYPWKNYDWNYANHVSNNYSPWATGAKADGTIKQAFKCLPRLSQPCPPGPCPGPCLSGNSIGKHSKT